MKRAETELLGLPFGDVTLENAVARRLKLCRARHASHTVITANASHLCIMRSDREDHRLWVHLLGGAREVVAAPVERSRARHPGLEIAGFREGRFGPDAHLGIVKEARAFVGISSPFKKKRCERRQRLEVPITVGVGGGFDVLAGFIKGATPRRLPMKSRNLWRHCLATNSWFIRPAGQEIVDGRLVRPPTPQSHT